MNYFNFSCLGKFSQQPVRMIDRDTECIDNVTLVKEFFFLRYVKDDFFVAVFHFIEAGQHEMCHLFNHWNGNRVAELLVLLRACGIFWEAESFVALFSKKA